MNMRKYSIIEILELNNSVDGTWTIDDEGIVHVDGNVTLNKKNIRDGEMIYNFGEVSGNFRCSGLKLNTLKGSPIKCIEFNCKNNYLKSLKNAPLVCNHLYCNGNNLIKLDWELESCDNLIFDFNKLPTQLSMFRLDLYLDINAAIKDGKLKSTPVFFDSYSMIYAKYIDKRIMELI
jgi:hypothetical protein